MNETYLSIKEHSLLSRPSSAQVTDEINVILFEAIWEDLYFATIADLFNRLADDLWELTYA